jgi:hypothetical protein
VTAAPTSSATSLRAPTGASRRAAVTASGIGVLALSACTGDRSGTPSSDGLTGAASPSTSDPALDPDRVALDRAIALTAGLLAETEEAGPTVDPGGRLAALHRSHLTALEAAAGATLSPEPVPRDPGRLVTRARLRRHEASAQRELATLALDAASGALARLLASMSAGIAAHLAVPAGTPR